MRQARLAWVVLLGLLALPALADDWPDEDELKAGPLHSTTRFLEAAHAGDFATAAGFLALEAYPEAERPTQGARLSRRLMFLLDQYVTLGAADSKAPVVGGRAQVGELPVGRVKVPVELIKRGEAWLFSARTLRAVDAAYDERGSLVLDWLPAWLIVRSVWLLNRFQWLGLGVLVLLGLGLAYGLTRVGSRVLQRVTKLTRSTLDDAVVGALERPSRALVFLGVLATGSRLLVLPLEAQGTFDDLLRSSAIAVTVWLLWVVSEVLAQEITSRAAQRDEVASRAVRTQVTLLHRVSNAVVLIVGGALVLVQFPSVRSLGVSLLASAGVAGVVIGLAAQRSIGSLLAGVQLSFTQPMRIGDTVVVEGEWGTVEEITLTYVVVKVWDLRRLVVPISTFLEKPFQNITRSSTELLGTVVLWADFQVDVHALRDELLRLLESERGKLWNGKSGALQVTDANDRAMQVRALVSADNSDKLWDLRCLVRERLLEYLKGQDPHALPRTRTEVIPAPPSQE